MRRYLRLAILAALVASALPQPAAARAPGERCFPETGQCISGAIRIYWERNGGLPIFGYPLSGVFTDQVEGSWSGPVQWFERDRLEDHSAERLGVLAGRLGAQMLELQGRPWQDLPRADGAPAGCRYFAATGHSLCGAFLRAWLAQGGLARFGYPLSEPAEESLMLGRDIWTGTVQYFERRRMELHQDLAGTPYAVLLGLLGRDTLAYAKALKCAKADSPMVDLAQARGYSCAGSLPQLWVPIATQPFERGLMIWLASPDGRAATIYVLAQAAGALGWSAYADEWRDTTPLPDLGQPPPGLLRPARGFGWIWATNPAVRTALGWATAIERGSRGNAQRFYINSGSGELMIIQAPAVEQQYLLYDRPRQGGAAAEVIGL